MFFFCSVVCVSVLCKGGSKTSSHRGSFGFPGGRHIAIVVGSHCGVLFVRAFCDRDLFIAFAYLSSGVSCIYYEGNKAIEFSGYESV